MSPIIHGAALSPFVRKVRIVHLEKGIEFKAIHVDPFSMPEEYSRLNPLRRIPSYEFEGHILCDSAIICAFVEKKFPEPALYPEDAYLYARAQWFEKFADYELAPHTTFAIFRNRLLMPLVGKTCNEEKVQQALNESLPPLLDILEKELGDNDYLVGNQFSIADIAMATQFINMKLGRESIDESRWPHFAAYIERLHNRDTIRPILEKELAFANDKVYQR